MCLESWNLLHYSNSSSRHGVRYRRGGPGGNAPPQKVLVASNAFGPQFVGKILLCTHLMYNGFLKKTQWNACIIVYIFLKFSKTSKFTLKLSILSIKFSKFLQIFFKTLTFLIYSKWLIFSQKI